MNRIKPTRRCFNDGQRFATLAIIETTSGCVHVLSPACEERNINKIFAGFYEASSLALMDCLLVPTAISAERLSSGHCRACLCATPENPFWICLQPSNPPPPPTPIKLWNPQNCLRSGLTSFSDETVHRGPIT